MSKVIVGVLGSIFNDFDKIEAWYYLQDALDRTVAKFDEGTEFVLMSNLVDAGLPQLAYYMARQKGWNIGGIAPKAAYNFKWFPMSTDGDMLKISGKNWGDETKDIVDVADILIKISHKKSKKKLTEKNIPSFEYIFKKD